MWPFSALIEMPFQNHSVPELYLIGASSDKQKGLTTIVGSVVRDTILFDLFCPAPTDHSWLYAAVKITALVFHLMELENSSNEL